MDDLNLLSNLLIYDDLDFTVNENIGYYRFVDILLLEFFDGSLLVI